MVFHNQAQASLVCRRKDVSWIPRIIHEPAQRVNNFEHDKKPEYREEVVNILRRSIIPVIVIAVLEKGKEEKIDIDQRLEAATHIMRHSIPKWIDALLTDVGDETQRSGVEFLSKTKTAEFDFFLVWCRRRK